MLKLLQVLKLLLPREQKGVRDLLGILSEISRSPKGGNNNVFLLNSYEFYCYLFKLKQTRNLLIIRNDR